MARAYQNWLFADVDARVYAAVRTCYAAACMCVVFELWPYREHLLAEGGITSRLDDGPFYLPLRHLRSSGSVTVLLLSVSTAAVALACGIVPRLMTLVLWAWSVSYGFSSAPADSGYDGVLRCVGFVLLLSPTGTWKASGTITPHALPAYGLLMLRVQLAAIYISTVWHKAPDAYWRRGDMMAYYMMSLYSRFPSPEWAHWERLSVLMSWSTLVIEAVIPVLIWSARGRRAALLVGLGFHLTIGVLSTVTLFSIAMLPLYASLLGRHELIAIEKVRSTASRAIAWSRADD